MVDSPTDNQQHVASDNAGNVYVSENGDGTDYQWLNAYRPDGSPLWSEPKVFPKANTYDLAAGQDGVYMVGSCSAGVDFDLLDPTKGTIEALGGFLAKFSAVNGDFMWALPFDGTVQAVTVVNNDIFVTGTDYVQVSKTNWRTDMLVARVTSP